MAEILHQLIGRLSHYLQGVVYTGWCRISSINSRDADFIQKTSAFLFTIPGLCQLVPWPPVGAERTKAPNIFPLNGDEKW